MNALTDCPAPLFKKWLFAVNGDSVAIHGYDAAHHKRITILHRLALAWRTVNKSFMAFN